MKILTANIALGLSGMDRVISNFRAHAAYHSWPTVATLAFPFLRGRVGRIPRKAGRTEGLQARDNLAATIALVQSCDPDIAILNEVVFETQGERLRAALKEMGFRTIAWGFAAHHEDARVSTWVAAKEAGAQFACEMPQSPYPGHGAGIAGMRLEGGISAIGVHLANGVALWYEQLVAVGRIVAEEKARGNHIVVAGDWNHNERAIFRHSQLGELGLVSADWEKHGTCPTYLPFRLSLDHIFISDSWKLVRAETMAFGSDHLALCAEVVPQRPTSFTRPSARRSFSSLAMKKR